VALGAGADVHVDRADRHNMVVWVVNEIYFVGEKRGQNAHGDDLRVG
jgi:hypothetical protein